METTLTAVTGTRPGITYRRARRRAAGAAGAPAVRVEAGAPTACVEAAAPGVR
ncbi:hypothetical protein ACF068_23650 [Streptomyces sp. NPDC016309]|uniref:hypothetical protein n=1 Tax=Streptomyces sp. NPDC016309 TaxID=3364965 RepID=UPI0036FD0100